MDRLPPRFEDWLDYSAPRIVSEPTVDPNEEPFSLRSVVGVRGVHSFALPAPVSEGTELVWSHDGERLVYRTDEHLMLLQSDGKVLARIPFSK